MLLYKARLLAFVVEKKKEFLKKILVSHDICTSLVLLSPIHSLSRYEEL